VPPWAYDGEPYAALIVQSSAREPTLSWDPPGRAPVDAAIAEFLESRRRNLDEGELSSGANFLYVVLRRAPLSDDHSHELGADTPIAEFGYGAPPVSPEAWPMVELKALLDGSVAALRRRGSA